MGEEASAIEFSLRGFGTLGIAESDAQHADFVGSFFQPSGAGGSHRWSTLVDSKLGAQVDVRFWRKFTAVVQLVAQHNADNTFTPQVEWANLKYDVTPDFSVRLGRTVTEQFMVSDTRLVGFASVWLRPPQELYAMAPFTNKDGVDAAYRFGRGETFSTLRASYGQTTLKLPAEGQVHVRDFLDVNHTLTHGPATLRVGYTSLKSSLRSPGLGSLIGGLNDFGNALSSIPGLELPAEQALSIAQKYDVREEFRYALYTIGAGYDQGAWLWTGEWATVRSSTSILDATAWYVMGGYRVGKFTPYLIYARLTANRPVEPGIGVGLLPPPLAAAAGQLNDGVNRLIDQLASAQRTVSLGVRCELARSIALKIQYDDIQLGADSSGRLGNVQAGFVPGDHLGALAVTVDFVF